MKCKNCGTLNPSTMKYCEGCGQLLSSTRSCPRCGTENPDGYAYCQNCGSALEKINHGQGRKTWLFLGLGMVMLIVAVGVLMVMNLRQSPNVEQKPVAAQVQITEFSTPSIPIHTPGPQDAESLLLACDAYAEQRQGEYLVKNNTWGMGSLTNWSECVVIGHGNGDSVNAHFTWDWRSHGGNVKAYPNVIYGYFNRTTTRLPIRVDEIQELTARYDISSSHKGSGNTAFDIWLTNTAAPQIFDVPPITHEIMIWLESYGDIVPGGRLQTRADIDGVSYNVYYSKQPNGMGYIAYKRTSPSLGQATLDILAIIHFTREKGWITGDEYVASVEIGNEVIDGSGETFISDYEVNIR